MSTIYKQDLGHPNWTGRVSRQARITGQWSANLEKQRCIPKKAYAMGILAFITFWVANFV
jgi:hypothetical protein